MILALWIGVSLKSSISILPYGVITRMLFYRFFFTNSVRNETAFSFVSLIFGLSSFFLVLELGINSFFKIVSLISVVLFLLSSHPTNSESMATIINIFLINGIWGI